MAVVAVVVIVVVAVVVVVLSIKELTECRTAQHKTNEQTEFHFRCFFD